MPGKLLKKWEPALSPATKSLNRARREEELTVSSPNPNLHTLAKRQRHWQEPHKEPQQHSGIATAGIEAAPKNWQQEGKTDLLGSGVFLALVLPQRRSRH